MRIWITAHDGSASFQCEAKDVPAAFELMARSMKYATFADMMLDTGRGPADFQVAEIRVEAATHDAAGNRKAISQQRDNAVIGAARQLLRRGG